MWSAAGGKSLFQHHPGAVDRLWAAGVQRWWGWQAVGAGTQPASLNPAWATYGFVEYDKLVGATASSPIVTEPGGSANQWTLGIGLTYSFAMRGLPF